MKLVKITPTTKLRVKEMMLNLFPEYEFVKVRKSGLVTLKRKWWSLKKDRINVTDLLVGGIPKQIADIAKFGGKGDEYLRDFNAHIASIIHIAAYTSSFCIVDYIWDKYVSLCLEVPVVSVDGNEFAIESDRMRLQLGVRNDYWLGIIRSFKKNGLPPKSSSPKWALKRHPSVLQKVNSIKEKVLN